MHDFVDTFAHFDAVVVPSGSCAGTVRHLYPMVAERIYRYVKLPGLPLGTMRALAVEVTKAATAHVAANDADANPLA